MLKGTRFISDSFSKKYFETDSPWFEENTPFFECSDPVLEEVYQYRWKLYKAHIRDLGHKGYVVTEFLDDVGWQKHPYAMLNDATGFHLYEGRWLRDRQYMDGFIDFLYAGGGNDRHFAESIADAGYAVGLVTGDLQYIARYLPAMKHIYNLWDDHYDFSKGLYFIEPLLDATEYTVSSIDASGGKDGFRGGDAFRPTINAYMYANALAISRLSGLAGDKKSEKDYAARAQKLKELVESQLWSEHLQHFADRYFASNDHVKYWTFIRARELAGYVPWAHNLPSDDPKYTACWEHLLCSDMFSGPFGLRTIEPSYEYYMKQYRYLGKAPECQWNGPSWPFQTTQVLLGIANILNHSKHLPFEKQDYFKLLRQYAQQHYLDGKLNLQEDYNPDTGKPIVGLDRSHHYNHSGFIDLIITGLCGLRPRNDNLLEVNPQFVESEIGFFCLENVAYHGHSITILWDRTGEKHQKGFSIFLNGKQVHHSTSVEKVTVPLIRKSTKSTPKKVNTALNIYHHGYPMPSASSDSDKTLWQAVDGRRWYFPEMVRGWSPDQSTTESSYEIDFGTPIKVSSAKLSFYQDGTILVPENVTIHVWNGTTWIEAGKTYALIPNTGTTVNITPTLTDKIRVVLFHKSPIRLVEITTY